MLPSRSQARRAAAARSIAALGRAAAPALLLLAVLAPPAAAQWDAPSRFEDLHAAFADAPVDACLSCHEEALMPQGNHPVGMYYQPGPRSSLRPRAEVERRGVALPDGKVHCWSCHALGSRWRYHLLIPDDATAGPRVVPGDPATYGSLARAAPDDDEGADVSPMPLCRACHTHGD